MIDLTEREKIDRIASQIIREQAYNLPIYEWMEKNRIGESEYGRYLDLMGRQEHVFHHRLFGHHPIYDFPFDNPEKIPDFIEHVWFSDSATKQGLPIVPGDFLKDTDVLKYCSQKTIEWNFVNAFDLLSGTLAIYAGYKNCKKYFNEMESIESFSELAKELGVGILELALSIKNTNPFLLIGAILQIVGSMKGVFNDASKIYFKKIFSQYYFIITDPKVDIDEVIASYYLIKTDLEKALSAKVNSYYLK
ncbi:MAG: hypothetical protein K9J16_08215 [Melioribacteraceae bacterium]|nr:hypothetical protein [Melioribacteraceae bacterium]MCF8353887.1 hypothetical protein [Melioribacteraceae bacterium]MCF8393120.1 hypothetical protein [Melioribacteraceae bacterium]MCF8419239.1 hypothetical protein [Melioribacteraceae bacterium]